MKRYIKCSQAILSNTYANDTLNPKIWNSDMTLREDVKAKLIDIVDEFVENSEIFTRDDIIDAELLGSNANYNYTDKSDIDLHLVVNMSDIAENTELVQVASNLEKSAFNMHYDIEIRNLEVEVYVEDVKAGTMSNGIYSLFNDEWIKRPEKQIIPDYSTDDEYSTLKNKWVDDAQLILTTAKSSKEIKSFIDKLYNLRRLSLMSDGEFARGNLVFKEIRNSGLLQQLKDRRYELASDELSID